MEKLRVVIIINLSWTLVPVSDRSSVVQATVYPINHNHHYNFQYIIHIYV